MRIDAQAAVGYVGRRHEAHLQVRGRDNRGRNPGTTAPRERAPRSPDDLYLQSDNPLCRL
jgi:hypothetical protein